MEASLCYSKVRLAWATYTEQDLVSKNHRGAGEMSRWLIVLPGLSEDESSVPSTQDEQPSPRPPQISNMVGARTTKIMRSVPR